MGVSQIRWQAVLAIGVLFGLFVTLMFALTTKSQEKPEDKRLVIYGCGDNTSQMDSRIFLQVCKVYDPETHKRFVVAQHSESISMQPID